MSDLHPGRRPTRGHAGLRVVLAAAACIAVAASLATPAAAAAPATTPDPGTGLAGAGQHQQVPAGAAQPAASGAGVTAAAVPAASCPAGLRQGRVLNAESFEDGQVSYPAGSYGWTATRPYAAAAAGSYVARSEHPASGAEVDNLLYLEDITGTPGVRTYLSFASRGNDVYDNIYFGANDEIYGVDLTPTWDRVTVEVTEALKTYGGVLDVGFQQYSQAGTARWWEVDDVSVYTCVAAPASGVRGDWTGEGDVDVVTTDAAGTLRLYRGNGAGGLGAGTPIGGGWAGMTYLGSPGDVNGDRRTDMVARSADGLLYLYTGQGDGVFGRAAVIGQKWNAMTALITSGDVNGDGRPDLMARRNDGTLHLYGFTAAGPLTYTRQIGSGWNGMAWMIGTGDLNNDGRGDVLGVTKTGSMYAYRGTGTSLQSMGLVGNGWGAMNWVTSPGDLDGDGRGDVLARNGSGALLLYPGKVDGVRAGTQVGTGWNGSVRIL